MPGSCSSNTPNGCGSCGPGLVLFVIAATTSQAMAGHLYESVYYKNFNRNLSTSAYYNGLNIEYDCTGDPIVMRNSGSISESSIYNYVVDQFGNIVIYVTGTSNSSLISSQQNTPEEDPYYLDGTTTAATVSAKDKCDPARTITTQDCKTRENIGFQGCIGIADCTGPSVEGDCGRYYRCEDTPKYSSPVDLQFIYSSLCEPSATTKIGILTDNQSQNCDGAKCGDGGKDDCWGDASSFLIADNNLDDPEANTTTSQKLKFKIGTLKEGFDKTYKSVSGTVKFYYGGEGGKTPCCDDDFDGTVVKETGYSISAGSEFKSDYLASDAGDFDNNDQSHVGETIDICYTVDNVSFI